MRKLRYASIHHNLHVTLLLLLILSVCTGRTYASGSECDFSDASFVTRPDPQGKPTEIAIGLYLIDVTRINDIDQSFTANISIRMKWRDPRLAREQHEDQTVCIVDLEQVWNPKVRVLNERAIWKRLADVVEIEADGTVTYVQRYNGTYTGVGDISLFPFDERSLPFSLVSVGYSSDDILLVTDEGWMGRSETLSIANWAIGQQQVSVTEYTAPDNGKFAQIDFTYRAERRSVYYIWSTIVPLVLIVFMSWSVFWINPQHFGAQLSVAATSMLTLIAHRFTLETILPPVAYLTSMDKFLTGSSILVFIALVETVTTSSLVEKKREELAIRVDTWSKFLFPMVFLAVITFSFWR